MHLAVEARLLHHLRPICLERAPVVVQTNTRDSADEAIRKPRRQSTNQPVLPFSPPAADDVVPLVDLVEQQGDVCRVVLKVPVHTDDDFSASMVEAGSHRGRLPKVPAQAHDPQPLVPSRERRQPRERLVAAPVVDDDDLEGTLELHQVRQQTRAQSVDVVLFLEHRNDDGNTAAGEEALPATSPSTARPPRQLARVASPRVQYDPGQPGADTRRRNW